MKYYSWIAIFCVVVLTAIPARSVIAEDASASTQQELDDLKARLYDNQNVFDQLSSAMQIALERKFGPKPARATPQSGAVSGIAANSSAANSNGPASFTITTNPLVNNPNAD